MVRLIISGIPYSSVERQNKGITGTVNGVSTVFVCDYFIKQHGIRNSVLVAYAEESATYNYNVVVDGVTYSGTIDNGDICKFVYDRTQDDVNYAKRLRADGRANEETLLKGCLNTLDFHRNITNITLFCNIYDETQHTPTTLPLFPGQHNFFDLMTLDLLTLSSDGFVNHATTYVEGAPGYDSAPPYNQWYTWNNVEETLFENWDVVTTRWLYFSGADILTFYTDDLDINEHSLFMYVAGDKYKVDISDACRYITVPAITRPDEDTPIYTFSAALNAVYAKILMDMNTLMLETSDGYVLSTNTGKVIVAKEDD